MYRNKRDEKRRRILADNIGRFRYQAGFSQQQLANLLGISKTSFQRYEWGKNEPRLPIIYRMAEYLKVDIRQLIMTEEEWKSIKEKENGN